MENSKLLALKFIVDRIVSSLFDVQTKQRVFFIPENLNECVLLSLLFEHVTVDDITVLFRTKIETGVLDCIRKLVDEHPYRSEKFCISTSTSDLNATLLNEVGNSSLKGLVRGAGDIKFTNPSNENNYDYIIMINGSTSLLNLSRKGKSALLKEKKLQNIQSLISTKSRTLTKC